ncbi:MAG: hypothetical protein ACJ788_10705 [Ktedonobacteraceae bacterium]
MPITRRRRANPPDQPEDNNNNNHASEQQAEQNAGAASVDQPSQEPAEGEAVNQAAPEVPNVATPPPPFTPIVPPAPTNGAEQQGYTPSIESGRRTSRGELFRRPPQPPQVQQPLTPVTAQSGMPLQAPTHEISLPLGNLLHLAYNPGYTGSDEARSVLLNQLANESKAGGRARCWNCGSIAIAYDRWSTRSKTFGEVGIAFCEICGVWSVL